MDEEATQCYCGVRAKVRTSWTDNNPGRRFFGCAKYNSNGCGCGYFGWFDPPMCPRGRQIIPRLLRRIEHYRRRERMYWGCIILSWVITTIVVVLFFRKTKVVDGGMPFLAWSGGNAFCLAWSGGISCWLWVPFLVYILMYVRPITFGFLGTPAYRLLWVIFLFFLSFDVCDELV